MKVLQCYVLKGEPGTGNIVEAVRHMRKVNSEVSRLVVMNDDEIMTYAKELGAPYEVLKQIKITDVYQ